jgi:hypothetical protein
MPSSPPLLSGIVPLVLGQHSSHAWLYGESRSGFCDRAEQKSSELDKTGIDGKHVHKSLEDGTKIRYQDAKTLWIEFVSRVSLPLPSFGLLRLLAPGHFEHADIVPNMAKTLSKMPTTWKPSNTLRTESSSV